MTFVSRTITARIMESALKKDGFVLIRQSGSHKTYNKGDRVVTIAYHHPGQTFPINTLKEIIKAAGWTEADLKQLKLIK